MTLAKIIIAWLVVTAVIIGIPVAYAGNCHQLFHHRQAVVAHHVAPVLYFAGQNTQDEAIVRKVVREELRQALQAPQQQTAATSGAFAKCAKCHKGDNTLTSDAETFKAFARMAGLGEGIPNEMKAVIGSLTPAEKGEITEYLLRMPAARTEPQITIPPPEPSGVLR
jgi:cytochrome c553